MFLFRRTTSCFQIRYKYLSELQLKHRIKMAWNVFLLFLFFSYSLAEEDWTECDDNECKLPRCLCASQTPPGELNHKNTPQFVMLAFDSAVNFNNFAFYQELILRSGRKNKKSGCSIAATFFVSHEYTDYVLLNRLYNRGNEIAVHSISHTPDVDRWKNLSYSEWEKEILGMRKIISKFSLIPLTKVNGVRAPFLQTGGDTYFRMLADNEFLYDSSMPTLRRANPPLWPYTLNYGLQQDCQIRPCPTKSYNDLWVIPLVNWFGLPQIDKTTGHEFEQACAMADGCTPEPSTVDETVAYLKKNFERHYDSSSRAPFPIFLREGWLQNKERKKGFLKFVDELLEMEDVYFVTIGDVIDYLRAPKNQSEFKQSCQKVPTRCSIVNCSYKMKRPEGEVERMMRVCNRCPKSYPWVDNPLGEKRD